MYINSTQTQTNGTNDSLHKLYQSA